MIIRKSELKSMDEKKLKEKLIDLRKELMKAKGKSASKAMPENPGKVREIKKTIARILTILNQRGIRI